MVEMIRAIIPACGFGTRMNMDVNKSKEMESDGYGPLIRWTLEQCSLNNIEPLVLVRKEKKDLIGYLEQNKVKYIVMRPGKEWAETVYNSREHWSQWNILILPDTRWSPKTALGDIKNALWFGIDIVFAVHRVEDTSKWGEISWMCYNEKPASNFEGYAWGLIGFNKNSGKDLFKNMQRKNRNNHHKRLTNFIFLDEFKDLTRTGKIE